MMKRTTSDSDDDVSRSFSTYLDFNLIDIQLKKSCSEFADEDVHGFFKLRHRVLCAHVHIRQDVQVHSGESTRDRMHKRRQEGEGLDNVHIVFRTNDKIMNRF